MVEEIKELWKDLDYKTGFIKEVAVEVDRSPNTLNNHWFSHFWLIPEEFQAKVKELLEKKIKSQSKQVA